MKYNKIKWQQFRSGNGGTLEWNQAGKAFVTEPHSLYLKYLFSLSQAAKVGQNDLREV